MICSIHQPNYIPYLWLFHKLAHSDVFVFYDIAQYTKGDYHNRNTIKWPNGPILLSLPVQIKLGQTIRETHFDPRILLKHLKTIQESYKKAPFFAEISPLVEDIYSYAGDNLSEFNIRTITLLANKLSPNVAFVKLSDIIPELESKSTEALIEISQKIWATKYISGAGGRGYLDGSLFEKAQISLEFQNFHHPIYPQIWKDFIPCLSIIDVLFNTGIAETRNLLKN